MGCAANYHKWESCDSGQLGLTSLIYGSTRDVPMVFPVECASEGFPGKVCFHLEVHRGSEQTTQTFIYFFEKRGIKG